MEVVVGMKKEKMEFDETELRLGIGSTKASEEVVRKRGFSETENHDDDDENTTMDLMLNLSSKEASGEVDPNDKIKNLQKEKTLLPDPAKPPTK
ncbi:auxin-induced protein aux28-like [Trifolium pratense]|uniref:Auxin-induced protein aux28-like n=1 Tax=Trifolium pratense TaxID=57577 RepID=A0A2K3L560_TRIPR|nr:auxin-induced protein aux28-like [Trifolium pratense]